MTDSWNDTQTAEFHGVSKCDECGEYDCNGKCWRDDNAPTERTPEAFAKWLREAGASEELIAATPLDPVGIDSLFGPEHISKHTVTCAEHGIRQDFTTYRDADRFAHAHRDMSH